MRLQFNWRVSVW